ncbi:hypothetical protein CMI48_03190 [Candidatus Pacearchaeota archaeon]|nr:hypothetical protein [Candidatus Pacearchaeota archaeon]|tara:strand:+ start:101 stop:352 length:252 start_codon:yes stop_codon:yes gene_type:complete
MTFPVGGQERLDLFLEVARVQQGNLSMWGDTKTWIYPSDLDLLLGAGAQPVIQNSPHRNDYIQEVVYEGMIFQTITDRPLNYE